MTQNAIITLPFAAIIAIVMLMIFALPILIVMFMMHDKTTNLPELPYYGNIDDNNRQQPLPMSPTTGYEYEYDPDWWEKFPYAKYHNCYDYAMGRFNFAEQDKTQPGSLNGAEFSDEIYTCDMIEARMSDDYPDARKVLFEEKCADREYKIAMLVAPGETPLKLRSDFHFMRQDSTGLWSHKSGENMPIDTDGDNKPINAPHTANRNTGLYNYSDLCGYWCVKRKDVLTGNTSNMTNEITT